MQIIMSYWSQPFMHGFAEKWHNIDARIWSWHHSLDCITKTYGMPILYTDNFGYDLLVKTYKLKFKHIEMCLTDIPQEYQYFYWYPKYFAASLQNKPFLHVDYDLFFKEPLQENIASSEIIFERRYRLKQFHAINRFASLSELQIDGSDANGSARPLIEFVYGTGIFGGSNINYFKFLHCKYQLALQNENTKIAQKTDITDEDRRKHKTLEYSINCQLLSENKIHVNVVTDENKKSSSVYSHVFLDKQNSLVNNKIKYRYLQIEQNTKSNNVRINDKKILQANTSLIIMPNSHGNQLETIVSCLIPKKIKINQIFVSRYKLAKHVIPNLHGLQRLYAVQEDVNYFNSLRRCLLSSKSDMFLILDENLQIDVECVFNLIASLLQDDRSIYCAAIKNYHTHRYLCGMSKIEYAKMPNVFDKLPNQLQKVDYVTGGLYAISRDTFISIMKQDTNAQNFAELTENYDTEKYCVPQSVAIYEKVPLIGL